MTTKIHNTLTCIEGTNGQPCEMCQFAEELGRNRSKSPSEASRAENQPAGFLEPEPENRLQGDSEPVEAVSAPDFDHEWQEAPRGMTDYVEQSIAEYWFLRGRRAGELNQMIEENRVFREMAERRGLL